MCVFFLFGDAFQENGDLDGVKSAIALGAPVNATNESLFSSRDQEAGTRDVFLQRCPSKKKFICFLFNFLL